ncbi:MAG: ATP-binding cassette domain-containing protein [Lachnospiraceae bacterium]|nr:ATP-binding cassette domain-containing protein [Lachnospiraceae bacterium]
MNTLTILPGHARDGTPETFEALSLKPGEILAVVGNTGSGKSRLIKDIEQLVGRDSVTGRLILLDGARIAPANRLLVSDRLVAHLSQNMRFVLDVTVAEFLRLHCLCRDKAANLPASVIALANTITPEPILPGNSLNLLSGGQSRALMIADIAMVCDSPIVLIDELENAGIDKKRAFGLLADSGKLILIVTHDPHTALMASRRIILEGGAIVRILERSKEEALLSGELDRSYERQRALQQRMRKGERLI